MIIIPINNTAKPIPKIIVLSFEACVLDSFLIISINEEAINGRIITAVTIFVNQGAQIINLTKSDAVLFSSICQNNCTRRQSQLRQVP